MSYLVLFLTNKMPPQSADGRERIVRNRFIRRFNLGNTTILIYDPGFGLRRFLIRC